MYYYRVSAINTFGTGSVSSVGNGPPLPTPPSSLSLSVVSNVAIDLSWTDPTGAAETGFKIERSLDGTNWTTHVANTGSTTLSYSDTGLTPLTTYHYRISTINISGTSVAGGSQSIESFGPPDAPTNLIATSLTQAHIKLDWTAPSDDNGATLSGYKIERGTDGTTFSVLVADTGNTNVTYTDTTGTAGTTYYYKVSSIKR